MKAAQPTRAGLLTLQRFVKEAAALARHVIGATKYRHDDHFAFMAAAFLSKQISHADSLLLLDDHRDTQLIARSMVEGMCQLFWAYHEADTRPLRWRLFSVIIDWRRMKAMENSGEPIAKARRQKIETQLKQHGGQFQRPITKSGAALTSGGRDPYFQDWTGGVNIRTIFEQASAELLYSRLYQPFAAWHHWSPAGIGPSVVRRRGIVTLYTRDVRAAMGATALAMQCLLESARLLDSHLKLGFDDRIASLRRRYISSNRSRRGDGEIPLA